MFSASFIAFDTVCTLTIFDSISNKAFEEIFSQVQESAKQVQNTLNMYDSSSELSRICNNYKADKPLQISETLIEFLLENQYLYRLSGGLYDPTIGVVSKMWNFTDDYANPPSPKKILLMLRHVGFEHVELDPAMREIRIHVPGMRIDPGASGKGFALQETLKVLEPFELISFCLDYGGNLFVRGFLTEKDGRKRKLKIGVRDSVRSGQVLTSIELSNEGIATSSWYEHGFMSDGKLYHHILDPRSGYPVSLTLSSVSIICDNAFFTDLLSTAYFLMGKLKGDALLSRVCNEKKIHVKSISECFDGHYEMTEFQP